MKSNKKSDKEICDSLSEMEKDEVKGEKEYSKLIGLMSNKYPEQAGKLNVNLGDEIVHEGTIKKILKMIKCK